MARKRIMIVEDERIVAWALTIQLESWGYSVTGTESSGKEAIEAFLREKPDLVLLDICLNDDIDGIEVAAAIKKTSAIPFIYITASEDPDTFARAKATEPVLIIPKPYDERVLRTVLAARLSVIPD